MATMKKGYYTQQIETMLIKEFEHFIVEGHTLRDTGNEEYFVIIIDPPSTIEIYDNYDKYVNQVTQLINDYIDNMIEGDESIVLEKVTSGNDSIIVLMTACK